MSGDVFTPFASGKASYKSATANGAFPDLIDKSCNETIVVVVLSDPPLPLFPTIFCAFTMWLLYCIIYLISNRLFVVINLSKCLMKEALNFRLFEQDRSETINECRYSNRRWYYLQVLYP